jgi:hypothetical protein
MSVGRNKIVVGVGDPERKQRDVVWWGKVLGELELDFPWEKSKQDHVFIYSAWLLHAQSSVHPSEFQDLHHSPCIIANCHPWIENDPRVFFDGAPLWSAFCCYLPMLGSDDRKLLPIMVLSLFRTEADRLSWHFGIYLTRSSFPCLTHGSSEICYDMLTAICFRHRAICHYCSHFLMMNRLTTVKGSQWYINTFTTETHHEKVQILAMCR